MRKSRFTEAQIVAILREFDAGAPAEELARRQGVHANTIRLWRIIARQTVKIDAMEELMRKTPGAFPASRSREGAANARPLPARSLCDRAIAPSIAA